MEGINNLMFTRTQEKGAVTPQETESDLPVSVQESLVEVWVGGGLLQGQGLWVKQTWVWHKPSWRRSPFTPP